MSAYKLKTNGLNHRSPSLFINKVAKSGGSLISSVVRGNTTGSQCNLRFFGGGGSALVQGIRDSTSIE